MHNINFPPLKRWSCATIDMFRTNGASGEHRNAHRTSTFCAARRGLSDDFSIATTSIFDPNDRQYRCCCGQSHSMPFLTGVRVIAGMLFATVLFEFWQLCWRQNGPDSSTGGSVFQLLFGLAIMTSVVLALWRECSALLLPYLLLQVVGLGAVFIIFLALLYVVVLDHDWDTIRSLVGKYGPKSVEEGAEEVDNNYIIYMGWTLCVSCLCLLLLQLWLISIVFACWRYFRDKQGFFGHSTSAHTTSALVVLCSLNKAENDVEKAGDSARRVARRQQGSVPQIGLGPVGQKRTMSANY